MQSVFPQLDPAHHAAHALHDSARDWPETNCYVDLWIEILHAAGLPPEAALGFTVEQDFEGDHFTFFKFPPEDLATLYGVQVQELALYDRLEAHLLQQASRGRLTLVEVDAFHLPDTRGVSYGLEHSKTTIGINGLDPDARRLHYFHNAGHFALEGADYDAILRNDGGGLFPYAEFVKMRGAPLPPRQMVQTALSFLERHLAHAPKDNPVRAFAGVIERQAGEISAREPAFFHKYAFNTLRQLGANFEMLGSHLDWLARHDQTGFEPAIDACRALSSSAKAFQFQLARATARKRLAGLGQLLDGLGTSHDAALGALRRRMNG